MNNSEKKFPDSPLIENLQILLTRKFLLRFILLIFTTQLVLLLTSCLSQKSRIIENMIVGDWFIINAKINDSLVVNDGFPLSRMLFSEDGRCLIPDDFYRERTNGKWELKDSSEVIWLVLNAHDSPLNGAYMVEFSNDEMGSQRLWLTSKHTTIECQRFSLQLPSYFQNP